MRAALVRVRNRWRARLSRGRLALGRANTWAYAATALTGLGFVVAVWWVVGWSAWNGKPWPALVAAGLFLLSNFQVPSVKRRRMGD